MGSFVSPVRTSFGSPEGGGVPGRGRGGGNRCVLRNTHNNMVVGVFVAIASLDS